jgi:hypothetical protein
MLVKPTKALNFWDTIPARVKELFGYLPPKSVKTVKQQLITIEKLRDENTGQTLGLMILKDNNYSLLNPQKEVALTNRHGQVLRMKNFGEENCVARHKNLFVAVRDLLFNTNGKKVYENKTTTNNTGMIIGKESQMVIGKVKVEQKEYKIPGYEAPQFKTFA